MKELYGEDLFGDAVEPAARGALAQQFIVPPFSVLSGREGDWQERKRAWLALGIQGELGRDTALIGSGSMYAGTSWAGYRGPKSQLGAEQGLTTSIFDPVLCELAYRWFCPPGGQVVDPFAGGSVRGIVAGILGYRYWGCDLRAEQIAANREQATELLHHTDLQPEWVAGDSIDTLSELPAQNADFVFSCPPYGNLEVYSEHPRDISNMSHGEFLQAYQTIIGFACSTLKPDRFAAFVVGDYRDKRGNYRNFVGETVQAFQAQGLELYNEAIFVQPAGSLPVRVTRQFNAGRKLGKTHQNLLVFVKGSGKAATTAIMDAGGQNDVQLGGQ